MRLTTYTDYTLRVLTRLALRPRDLTTISEIVDSYGISKNHLMKVIHRFGIAGYIETVRGRYRRIRLRKRPGDINIGEIVRRMEPDFDLVPCFTASNACVIEPVCVLKDALADARDAFRTALERYTLVALVAPRRKLAALLNPQPRPL